MVGDIDFSAERWTGVLAPLNDSDYFAEVSVDPEAGTVVWPDGIDLAPELLYEQAKAHPLWQPPEAGWRSGGSRPLGMAWRLHRTILCAPSLLLPAGHARDDSQ